MNGNLAEKPLRGLRSRLAAGVAARALVLLPCVWAAVVLALVAADAALDLSDGARAALAWILGACFLALLGQAVFQVRRLTPGRVARRYEQTYSRLGSKLSNGVELASKPGATGAQEFLRLEALDLARRASEGLKAWTLLKPGARAGLALFGVPALVCAALLSLSGGGGLWRAEGPRFLDPRGDHPPYNRLRIEVVPKTASVLYGGELEVRATVSGRPVDKVWLVARTGRKENRTLMFLGSDGGYFQRLANLQEPAEYYVTDGAARSHRYPLNIRLTPQIESVEVTIEYPPYTSKPARTAKLSSEPQALPEGSRITFKAASNRPLKAGELTLTPSLGGKVVKVALTNEAQNNAVRGGFVLAEPVVFSLAVFDKDGLASANPRQGRFNILPDERPRIFVMEPGRDAVATPQIQIPVRVQAEDDYAVSRVAWLRGFNRSTEQSFRMPLTLKNGARSVEGSGVFDLEKLGVRAGDLIEYYFEAADNDPKGPNLTVSKLYRIEIISKEQYEAILKQAKARKELFEPYIVLSRWFQRLAERARDLDNKAVNGTAAEMQAAAHEAAVLAGELEKYDEQLSKLMGQAAMFDVEQSFKAALVDQETRIANLPRDLRDAGRSGALDPARMSAISKTLSELAGADRQEVLEPAEQIAAVAALLAKADAFARMADEQARVAQMLRRLALKTSGLNRVEQMEVQEFAQQQRRLRRELAEWLVALPGLVDQLPLDAAYDPLRKQTANFIAAVSQAGIESDMAGAIDSLAGMEAAAGQALAQSAAEKMDKLVSKCPGQQEGNQALCMKFQPSKIGRSLEQILSAMGASSGQGNGPSNRNGYSMFNSDVALFGPGMERNGGMAAGQGNRGAQTAGTARSGQDPAGTPAPAPQDKGRVRMQTEAKFPLRYRDVVGDYFRSIAESEEK